MRWWFAAHLTLAKVHAAAAWNDARVDTLKWDWHIGQIFRLDGEVVHPVAMHNFTNIAQDLLKIVRIAYVQTKSYLIPWRFRVNDDMNRADNKAVNELPDMELVNGLDELGLAQFSADSSQA